MRCIWLGSRLDFRQKQQKVVCSDIFFFQAEDGIRDLTVTGVQTCALPISRKTKTLTVERNFECAHMSYLKWKTEHSKRLSQETARLHCSLKKALILTQLDSEIGRASCRERV